MLLAESDLRDYPCMFLRGDGRGGFTATFPRVPKEYGPKNDRSLEILSEETYIARTEGARTFPWRVAAVAREDADLVRQELVWLLAEPAAERDWSWVQPGLVSWDWWNGMRLTGVDFRAGRNTESYRRYIDFAAEYGIPYIMDEGWSASTTDVFRPNPNLDLEGAGRLRRAARRPDHTLAHVAGRRARHGAPLRAARGVGHCGREDRLHGPQRSVDGLLLRACDALRRGTPPAGGLARLLHSEGAFPDLSQPRQLRGCARHGAGARCQPENSNLLPFIRNAVGPMDFTPGAMLSAQPEENRSTNSNPMGSGTRAYQLALYVLFEAPLQMLADSPMAYERERPSAEFIASVPTTWDELRVLHAACGKHSSWRAARGRSGTSADSRTTNLFETEIALDFLPAGRKFRMTSFEDGVNADLQAMDYRRRVRIVDASMRIPVKMVRNGGWAAVIE